MRIMCLYVLQQQFTLIFWKFKRLFTYLNDSWPELELFRRILHESLRFALIVIVVNTVLFHLLVNLWWYCCLFLDNIVFRLILPWSICYTGYAAHIIVFGNVLLGCCFISLSSGICSSISILARFSVVFGLGVYLLFWFLCHITNMYIALNKDQEK